MPSLSEVPHPHLAAQKADILIIDDDPVVRASVSMVMRSRYQTHEAGSAEEGLRLYRQIKPDAITLDLCMPHMDGLHALREIRRLDPDIPVIILTGHASAASARDALKSGASDYLEKPFDASTLISTIESHLANRPTSQTCKPETPPTSPTAQAQDPLLLWDVLHDLRNPLTVIQLHCDHMAALMDGGKYSDAETLKRVRESLATAREQSAYCAELLNHSNDLGQIIRQAPVRMNLTKVLQDVQGDILHLAEGKNITLNARIPSAPVWIMGNPRELRRMLNNIFINAIHAVSPWEGEVQIEAVAGPQNIRISIRDNGPGIPPAIIDSIFKPFFTTKGKGGSGLGLHIARFIARAHRGDITAHNLPGAGCRFDILLPGLLQH